MGKPKVPVEWTTQSAVWLTWPSQERWWKNCRLQALDAFANLVGTIAKYEKVKLNCSPDKIDEIGKFLSSKKCRTENIGFFPHETDDVWCRDCGGIFRTDKNGLEILDFKYNAWGGKFEPFDRDDALASKMAKAAGVKSHRIDGFICEGGALEMGEDGTLMTTKSVILNPNRNRGISQPEAEQILKQAFGAEQILWLDEGLFNDDTDGHIDNIARFAPNNTIICSVCGRENPSYKNLSRNLEILKSARNTRGEKFNLIELPLPEQPIFRIEDDGSKTLLPASYANWLVVNNAVLMPSFNQPKSDNRARMVLQRAFADRTIEMLDSSVFLQEGGAIHCLTQQQPLPAKV